MTPFAINQDADRSVYVKAQVEQVEHSTVSQLIHLSLCDTCVLGNLFIFCDLIVLLYTLTAAITNFCLLVEQVFANQQH